LSGVGEREPEGSQLWLFRWPVDVLFDKQGKMYLDAGLKMCARTHNLEVGYLLHYLYEGDGDMTVRVFDDSSCRRHCRNDDSAEDTDTNKDQL
jgi:hypothetical protein